MVKTRLISLLCGSFAIFKLLLSCMQECTASVVLAEAVIYSVVVDKSIITPSDKLVRRQAGKQSRFQ